MTDSMVNRPRTFKPGDAEPADRPALLDTFRAPWLWNADEGAWERQAVVIRDGIAYGSPTGLSWSEILDEYGPLREATQDEAAELRVTWTAE